MFQRARAWLQDLAHLFTIVSAFIVLGVGGTLAVAFQAVLAAIFTLSSVERTLLGVCAFMLVLAVVIAVSKRIPDKRPAIGAHEDNTAQELEHSRVELRESRQECEGLRSRTVNLESEVENLRRDAGSISEELSVAKRENEQLAAEVGRLRSFEEGFAEQLAITTSLEAEIGRLKSRVEQDEGVAVRLDAFGRRLVEGADLPNDQTSDEDLRKYCQQLAEDLHQFLEDYAMDEAARAEAMGTDFELAVMRADTETMREFRKRLKPSVMRMLAELKRRDWWKEQDLDLPEWEAVESLAHPQDLEIVAYRLERLGYGV